MSLRRIYYSLSPRARLLARRILYGPGDFLRSEKYENGLPVPPRALVYTGSGNFKETGERFVKYFKYHGLSANDDVLDIGSGMGRIALPLTLFLEGDYLGLDIMPLGVKWCSKNISPVYPNFDFKVVNARNDLYNDSGGDASDVRFPAEPQSFDFCCLISVFTHMLPSEVEHYIDEIVRVLKPGGLCFATFFIFKRDKDLIENYFQNFIKQDSRFALMDERVTSANVAYSENYIMSMLQHKGFELVKFSRGKWIDSEGVEDFQDFVVLRKK